MQSAVRFFIYSQTAQYRKHMMVQQPQLQLKDGQVNNVWDM